MISYAGGRPPEVWCPVVCGIVKGAAKSGFQEVVGSLASGAQYMLKFLATFWMKIPDPQVSGGSTAGELAQLTSDQHLIVVAFAVLGFLAGLARLVWENRHAQSAKELVRGLVVMTAASALALPITQALLDAGNAYSPWILQQATGASSGSDAFSVIIEASLATSATPGGPALGAWFILSILLILASLVQIVFMIVRGGVIYCLMVFLPYTSSTAFSEEGWGRFKRVAMLLFAFTIYKPVAATIYATGFKVMHTPVSTDKILAGLMAGVYGLTILVLAALALPALIKFLMPMAALGSSSAFSGAAAVAAIGTGAAMLATGGAAGGAAAAGGGAAGAGGAGAGLAQTGGSTGPLGGSGAGATFSSPSGGGDPGGGQGGGQQQSTGEGAAPAGGGPGGGQTGNGQGGGTPQSGSDGGGNAGAGAGAQNAESTPGASGAGGGAQGGGAQGGGSGRQGQRAAEMVGAALQQIGNSANNAVGDGAERTSW